MADEKILIVEDEPVVRGALAAMFAHRRCTPVAAGSLAEAETLVGQDTFDLIMLDQRLPDGEGLQFLGHIGLSPTPPPVVMITGDGSIEDAVQCMRAGAFDYVQKPFHQSQIDIVLKKAQDYRHLCGLSRYLNDQGDGRALLGRSPAMNRLRQLIDRVAPTDATVFVMGESGTGKEVVAREIYRRSPRRNHPFITVNCAAISENLIESEFFGHERGAFTGATEKREGRFELASTGTLLLDEVSEIPANLQAKLLRVLQERRFERVGGSKTIEVDVRLIATSNRELMACVDEGTFRLDLYHRLNVFPVVVPPLRERGEDVILLAEHFLRTATRKHGVRHGGFSDAAVRAIRAYRWPGNVRELQNAIERAVILSEPGRPLTPAMIGVQADVSGQPELPWAEAPAPAPEPPGDLPLDLATNERQLIRRALEISGGVRVKAAGLLGIGERTLRYKIKEYEKEDGAELLADAIRARQR
jgi:DNA-binding NtrC family response regulator